MNPFARATSIIFLFIISFSFCASANDGTSARELYDQSKYSEALELLKKNGLKNSANYNNAGLSAARLNKLGLAYAYFRKAGELNPDNEDIAYNARWTYESLQSAGSIPRKNSLKNELISFSKKQSVETWVLCLTALSLAIAVLCVKTRKQGLGLRSLFYRPSFSALFALWLMVSFATMAVFYSKDTVEAIVADDLIQVRSGPGETFTELTKLPAGSSVYPTRQSRDGWIQVRFLLGNVGWVMEKEVISL